MFAWAVPLRDLLGTKRITGTAAHTSNATCYSASRPVNLVTITDAALPDLVYIFIIFVVIFLIGITIAFRHRTEVKRSSWKLNTVSGIGLVGMLIFLMMFKESKINQICSHTESYRSGKSCPELDSFCMVNFVIYSSSTWMLFGPIALKLYRVLMIDKFEQTIPCRANSRDSIRSESSTASQRFFRSNSSHQKVEICNELFECEWNPKEKTLLVYLQAIVGLHFVVMLLFGFGQSKQPESNGRGFYGIMIPDKNNKHTYHCSWGSSVVPSSRSNGYTLIYFCCFFGFIVFADYLVYATYNVSNIPEVNDTQDMQRIFIIMTFLCVFGGILYVILPRKSSQEMFSMTMVAVIMVMFAIITGVILYGLFRRPFYETSIEEPETPEVINVMERAASLRGKIRPRGVE